MRELHSRTMIAYDDNHILVVVRTKDIQKAYIKESESNFTVMIDMDYGESFIICIEDKNIDIEKSYQYCTDRLNAIRKDMSDFSDNHIYVEKIN